MVVVNSRRKGTLRSLVAKLLVLGDKQTGKSASIVRYTTGRFIEQYSESTSDWLYRHSLGFDAKRNLTTLVELIEQKDIQICNSSSHFFASSTSNLSQIGSANGNQQHSLSSRVALDLQADLEMHNKQQLLNKLHWANAYIVIYAINDINSFNKAIKYLNLIANNINSPSDNKTTCSNGNTSFSFTTNNHCAISNGFLNRLSPAAFGGSTNPTTPTSRQCSPMLTSGSAGGNSNNCGCVAGGSSFNLSCNNSPSSLSSSPAAASANSHNSIRRPILLLGNKRDLEKSGRQVNAQDGRLLAMRHQSMFAEVSIAESDKLIEIVLANLIEQIDPACLQVEHLSPQQQAASFAGLQQIVRWSPTIELALIPKHSSSPLATSSSGGPPVWASLVKSQLPIGSAVIQSNRLETADVRSIQKPAINSTSALAASICQPVDHSLAETITTRVAAPRRLISCSRELVGAPEVTVHQVANSSASSAIKGKLQTCHKLAVLTNNISAYQNLKTSFRRASMAIIGSKTLAKSAKPTTASSRSVVPKGQKYGCETISSFYFAKRAPFREKQCNSARDSIGECSDLIATDQHRQSSLSLAQATSTSSSSWLRNHVGLGRGDKTDTSCRSSCSDLKMMKSVAAATLDSNSEKVTPTHHLKQHQQTDEQHAGSRFKPLFKYKSRRKTVAFDQVVKGSSLEDSISASLQTDSGLCNSLQPKTPALYKHGSEDSTNSMTSTITTTTMPMTSTSCNASYDSTRCNSNRSSSSLSTMDAFYTNQNQLCDAMWNTERVDTSSNSACSSNDSKEGGSGRGCPSSGVRCVVTRSV